MTQHPAPLVRRALSRTKIAAVGPIVAEAIRSCRLRGGLEPRTLLVHEAAGGGARRGVRDQEGRRPDRHGLSRAWPAPFSRRSNTTSADGWRRLNPSTWNCCARNPTTSMRCIISACCAWARANAVRRSNFSGARCKLAPRNPDAWNSLANMLLASDPKAAEIAYTNAINLRPDFAGAWYNFGNMLRDQHRPQDALHCYRRVLDLKPRAQRARTKTSRASPPGAATWPSKPIALARSRARQPRRAAHAGRSPGQNTPQRADDAYIVDIFDRAAGGFDSVLAKLEYAAPNLLTAALARVIADGQAALDILDAGCGTGCAGRCCARARASSSASICRPACSPRRASARSTTNCTKPSSWRSCAHIRASYDVVISADTLVYFGALEEAMVPRGRAQTRWRAGIHRRSRACWIRREFPPAQRGRYSHGAQYVRDCLNSAKLKVLQIESAVPRKEAGADIPGYVVMGSFTVS